MHGSLALTWDGTFQALILLGILLFGVAGTTLAIRQRLLTLWLAAWGTLLLSGALMLAAGAETGPLLSVAYLLRALVAPLLLMGSLECAGRRGPWHWPLVAGVGAGLIRVAFVSWDAPVLNALHGVVVAPAFLVAAAVVLLRTEEPVELRRAMAIGLLAFVGVEVYDAASDYIAGGNTIAWRGYLGVCLPLAAIQISSSVLSFGDTLARVEATRGAIAEERDEAYQRLDAIFAQVDDLIAEMGEDTRIFYVNDRVRTMLGFEPADLIGRYAIDFVPESEREAAAERFRRRLKLGPHQEPERVEFLDGEGGTTSLEFSMARYDGPAGARLLVVVRDISERVAYERALEDRVEERTAALRASHERIRGQERLAAVGTLASGIAHQINNPVGAISAAAEFALATGEDEDGDEMREQSLRTIVDEAARAGRIVRDILRFARHGETTKWPEDLGAVVRRSVELSRDYVSERGGRIEMDLSTAGLPVAMSPIQIEQMIVNLVHNAAEAGPDGAHVVVSLAREGDRAVIRVTDDGRGMAPEERDRAFDPFFTTRVREGGAGLGLSIVHGIVEDHQGTIDIDSAPGVGTTIRIAMPLVAADDVAGDAPPPMAADAAAGGARLPMAADARIGLPGGD